MSSSSGTIIRNAKLSEVSKLKTIWEHVFGNVGKDEFFKIFFDPGLCVIAEHNNAPASMGFLVPFGDIVHCDTALDNSSIPGAPTPCAMIFAVATLPECRSMGFGALVVNELIRLAHELGYPAVVLCPSDDGLFDYYSSRSEMHDWFYIYEHFINIVDDNAMSNYKTVIDTPPLIKLTLSEYNKLREELLKDITHIRHDIRVLEYQAILNKEHGGGFYQIGNSCATIEFQSDGSVWVKELLISQILSAQAEIMTDVNKIISAIMDAFPAQEYVIRSPSSIGKKRRFGMLTANNNIGSSEFESWYGFAFD